MRDSCQSGPIRQPSAREAIAVSRKRPRNKPDPNLSRGSRKEQGSARVRTRSRLPPPTRPDSWPYRLSFPPAIPPYPTLFAGFLLRYPIGHRLPRLRRILQLPFTSEGSCGPYSAGALRGLLPAGAPTQQELSSDTAVGRLHRGSSDGPLPAGALRGGSPPDPLGSETGSLVGGGGCKPVP